MQFVLKTKTSKQATFQDTIKAQNFRFIGPNSYLGITSNLFVKSEKYF